VARARFRASYNSALNYVSAYIAEFRANKYRNVSDGVHNDEEEPHHSATVYGAFTRSVTGHPALSCVHVTEQFM